ncbi:MAG: type II secretion system protein [Acidobacteriota bacterium]|jgi:general secretion pathway protein G|nr:type II secretion system protein [Acidobacteriota bacterium]
MKRGFTLAEILIVMALIGILVAILIPNYSASVQRAKESVLKENLFQIRDAIEKFTHDKHKYPTSLEDLVQHRYLKRIPENPFTRKADWVPVYYEPADDEDYDPDLAQAIVDVRVNTQAGEEQAGRYENW